MIILSVEVNLPCVDNNNGKKNLGQISDNSEKSIKQEKKASISTKKPKQNYNKTFGIKFNNYEAAVNYVKRLNIYTSNKRTTVKNYNHQFFNYKWSTKKYPCNTKALIKLYKTIK